MSCLLRRAKPPGRVSFDAIHATDAVSHGGSGDVQQYFYGTWWGVRSRRYFSVARVTHFLLASCLLSMTHVLVSREFNPGYVDTEVHGHT